MPILRDANLNKSKYGRSPILPFLIHKSDVQSRDTWPFKRSFKDISLGWGILLHRLRIRVLCILFLCPSLILRYICVKACDVHWNKDSVSWYSRFFFFLKLIEVRRKGTVTLLNPWHFPTLKFRSLYFAKMMALMHPQAFIAATRTNSLANSIKPLRISNNVSTTVCPVKKN